MSVQTERVMPIVRIKPPESLSKGLATKRDQESWTDHDRAVRSCQHCHRRYTNAGYAWRCEHYHEGLQ